MRVCSAEAAYPLGKEIEWWDSDSVSGTRKYARDFRLFDLRRSYKEGVCKLKCAFDPNKISGLGKISWLLVHVLPGTNKQREFKPSIRLS